MAGPTPEHPHLRVLKGNPGKRPVRSPPEPARDDANEHLGSFKMTEKKKQRSVPGYVPVGGDAFASVETIKTDAEKLQVLRSELAGATLTIHRAASLAAYWGLQENFEHMLAEMIVEAQKPVTAEP